MVSKKKKRYSASFKAQVALEAIQGELTAAQLAASRLPSVKMPVSPISKDRRVMIRAHEKKEF